MIASLPVLTKVAMTVINAISKIAPIVQKLLVQLPLIVKNIKPVAEVLFELNKLKGQFTQVNSTDELAARIKQSDLNEHQNLDSLLDEIERNPASSDVKKQTNELSDEEKLEPATAILVAALNKKYGSAIVDLTLLTSRNPEFFNASRLACYLTLVEKGEMSLIKITDYFGSNLSARESQQVEKTLIMAEQYLQGSCSQDELKTQLQQECE